MASVHERHTSKSIVSWIMDLRGIPYVVCFLLVRFSGHLAVRSIISPLTSPSLLPCHGLRRWEEVASVFGVRARLAFSAWSPNAWGVLSVVGNDESNHSRVFVLCLIVVRQSKDLSLARRTTMGPITRWQGLFGVGLINGGAGKDEVGSGTATTAGRVPKITTSPSQVTGKTTTSKALDPYHG